MSPHANAILSDQQCQTFSRLKKKPLREGVLPPAYRTLRVIALRAVARGCRGQGYGPQIPEGMWEQAALGEPAPKLVPW